MALPLDQMGSVASRMNRLPPTAFFTRLVCRAAFGAIFEMYELFLTGYVAVALVAAHLFTVSSLAYFVGAGFAGMFLGTNFFGRMSDKLGRRQAYTYSVLLYSIGTLFVAFAPTATWILVFRLISGIGVGAQLVIVDTYVSEMTPFARRGYYISLSQFIGFCVVPVVALIAYLLVPTHFLMAGWRWVMLIGALGAVLIWWIRAGLYESPRWYETQKRFEEANGVMTKIEEIVEKESMKTLPPITETAEVEDKSGRFAELWSPALRGRTIMLMVFQLFQTLGFYGFASWVPTLLVKEGVTIIHSLLYTFIIAIANPVGPLVGMWTSERFQRKWLIAIVSIGIGLFGLIFSAMRIPLWIIVFGLLITIFNNWFSALFHSYQAELYPTRIRSTGVGFTYSWSRFSAIFTSFIIVWLLNRYGVTGVFVAISIAMLIVAIVIGGFGPRTNRRALEDIAK
ncbi:MFS transporter [Alicyclobacillus tolerans]|uniref:MFS transporter n=1 Tax=Alicyclobacillus tolerans TaxID=90970 RepID=UPI001F1CEA80|nr:MFS transporter [Alicyclobacillus tolerans]MCF8565519.1 MFS transporter [Alicyclobacillus tolerans]